MLTKEKKEALTLMITLKNRKIESLISDNKGRIRCHLDQLLREPKTKFNKLKIYTSNKFRIFLSF